MDDRFDRIGLAVHPRRELDSALATVRDWAERQGAEVVQIASSEREVAPRGEAADCDLAIALGGDGTTLAALHAAAPVGRDALRLYAPPCVAPRRGSVVSSWPAQRPHGLRPSRPRRRRPGPAAARRPPL